MAFSGHACIGWFDATSIWEAAFNNRGHGRRHRAEGALCSACPPMHCLQSRGADPSIKTEDYDPYLNPGRKLAVEVRDGAWAGGCLPASRSSPMLCWLPAGCALREWDSAELEASHALLFTYSWPLMMTAAPSGASCWAWRRSMLGWPGSLSPTPTWAAGGPCMTMAWSRSRPGTGLTSTPTQVCQGVAWAELGLAVTNWRLAHTASLHLLPLQTLPSSGLSRFQTAEAQKRVRDEAERKRGKEERRKAKAAADAAAAAGPAKPVAVPATPIAFLFPGQGSQAVGMLKVRVGRPDGSTGVAGTLPLHLVASVGTLSKGRCQHCRPSLQESADLPAVKKMLEAAQRVLGYDLLQLCLEGPKEKLDDTVYSQVCGCLGGWAGRRADRRVWWVAAYCWYCFRCCCCNTAV